MRKMLLQFIALNRRRIQIIIFMPPTAKKLRGQFGLGLSLHPLHLHTVRND